MPAEGFASYTVKGDKGYNSGNEKTFTSAGEIAAYEGLDENFTFTCTLSDPSVYEHTGWRVGSETADDTTLKRTFNSAVTVEAIIGKKKHYTVTLAAPEITGGFDGYTVTGAGISGTMSLSEGPITAYEGGNYTITCALKNTDVYEFVGWDVNGTVTETSSTTLTMPFASAATVRAVLNKKEQYTLTVAPKPTGVLSYAVTGPSGAEGLSSNGGSVSFFGATDCTFNCTVDDNYKFLKWVVTDASGTYDRTDRPFAKKVSSSTTITPVVRPKETYELTLAKPEGVTLYAVTGPGGAAVSFSEAGKATIREADSYTFVCTINEVEYVFDKWVISDSSGNQIAESAERTFTTTFSSVATVTAIVHAKAVYEVTFVKPEGVASYAMTGPSGAVTISAEGKASVYESDSYTISCTYDDDNYEFTKWVATDSSGTVQPTTSTLTKTFTSAATVTVVLTEACIAKCLPVPSGCSYNVKQGNSTQQKVTTSEVKFRGNLGQTLKVTLSSANAGGNYQFVGWYRLYKNGVKEYLSYFLGSTVSVSNNASFIVGAEFQKVEDSVVHIAAPADGKINYSVSGGASGVVDGDDYDLSVAAGKDVTLTATFDNPSESRRAKWYTKDDSDAKIYFSIDNPVTRKFASSATLGVDFIPVNTNIMNAIEAAQSSTAHEAILKTDAEIVLDTSVEIPSDITIDLDGHTLYVDGTLTVNGTLTLNGGTVSKCQKLLKQTGDGLSPCNPYGSIKYWKTATATSSASITGSGWSGTASTHVTIMRGDGVAIRKVYTGSPAVLKCKANANIAANHITSITSAETGKSRTGDNLTCPPSKDPEYLAAVQTVDIDMLVIVDSGVSIVGAAKSSSDSRVLYQGVVDCAGYDCGGLQSACMSDHIVTYLNGGTISVAPGSNNRQVNVQNATLRFVNCKSVTYMGKARNTPHYYYYDCDLTVGTFSSSGNSGDSVGVKFIGGKYDYGFSGYTDSTHTRIYAGAFKDKPDKEKWLLEELKPKMTFVQHADAYWYLEPNQDPNVASINGTPYMTLDLALDYLKDNDSATITLLKNASLDSPYTLAAGKNLTIELGGCHIDAPNGFIKNYGALSIRDNNNSLAVCGVTAGEGYNIVENYGNGTVDICYGLYNGNFVVNGGTFTTHHGKFTGAVINNGGELYLKGGVFSSNVSSLMNEGYHAFSFDGWYYVGRFPKPVVDSSSLSGFAHAVTAMPSADKTLYLAKKDASLSGCSNNVDEWKSVAELKAAYSLLAEKSYIDILVGFDRGIANNTVEGTVKGKSALTSQSDWFPDMDAGVLERIFSPRITKTQISYARFIYDDEGKYDKMEAGISSNIDANKGTVCVLAMDLWNWNDSRTKEKKVSYLTILALPYVFGAGSNKAMIRSATGVATFYSTLSTAMGTVANGGTVMLANDCTEKPNFTKEGTYIIDSMGFEHSFSDAEGGYTVAEGLSVTTEIVDSSVATLKIDDKAVLSGAVAIKYVVSKAATHPADFVVIPSVPVEWEAANGLEGLTPEDLKNEDTNGNATWENAVMGQNRTTPAEIVTSTNGTETTANMEVSFKPPSGIGYTVKYAFDEVAIVGAATNVVHEGSVTNSPTLDLSGVTTNSPSYFKMRAVLESTDDKHTITTNVPVEHVVGVLKVDSNAAYTIIAVPWKSFHNTDVNVAELVHAASLSTDDMLYAYDGNGNLKSWCVKDGVWVPATDVVDGAETPKSDPAAFGLARGKGVWLKRSDTSKPIYLMGMPTSDAATTTLPAASGEEPSWNLLASPKLEAEIFDKFNTGDEIVVPTAGTPKHYTYKDNAWGYPGATVTEEKKLPNGQTIKVIKTEHKTKDTTVAPGTGFWYLNKGGAKTITW